MKKIIGAAIISATLAACNQTPDYTDTQLSTGVVRVYDFGNYKLHAYDTKDVMTDVAYLVETPTNLIAIEGPAFKNNITTWREYVSQQSKPLTSALSSYHANPWYDANTKNYATPDAVAARTQGDIAALVSSLSAAFGPDFDSSFPTDSQMLNIGDNTIDGVHFIITDDAGGYTIEIPEMKVLYVHMLGADSHSILSSIEHMNALIQQLQEYKTKNYRLILSSHHMPETADALDAKIAYIKTTKGLAKSSNTADEFKSKMKEKFPDYNGENYLDMTAGNLFK